MRSIPWDEWVEIIRPYYPTGTRASAHRDRIMLRMYLLQCWFSLSDEGVEDAIYDSYAMRKFMGINFLSRTCRTPPRCFISGICWRPTGLGSCFLTPSTVVWSKRGG